MLCPLLLGLVYPSRTRAALSTEECQPQHSGEKRGRIPLLLQRDTGCLRPYFQNRLNASQTFVCFVFTVVLRTRPRTLNLLGQCYTSEVYSVPKTGSGLKRPWGGGWKPQEHELRLILTCCLLGSQISTQQPPPFSEKTLRAFVLLDQRFSTFLMLGPFNHKIIFIGTS